jgi:hypothetical protein
MWAISRRLRVLGPIVFRRRIINMGFTPTKSYGTRGIPWWQGLGLNISTRPY